MLRLTTSLFLLSVVATGAYSAEPRVVKLWAGAAPGEKEAISPEKYLETKKGQLDVKRRTNAGEPTISVYSPPKGKANGAVVVVVPGGGYSILAIEHEGTDVCDWLNSLGVTAVLLKYRVPKRAMQSPENLAMLQDAQRAITLVRSLQTEIGIDPTRLGMLGFSAGGHLTACAALIKKRTYEPVDDADKVYSHEPNFALLIYPAYLSDKAGDLRREFAVKPDSPPMFFAHSSDDGVSSENSVALYRALVKNKVSAELHLYAAGGHGYGMRKTAHPCATWPDRAADWMNTNGWLEKEKPSTDRRKE